MVKDTIAQLVTGIKNGSAESKEFVSVPQSSLIEQILEVLKREGFIDSFSKKGKKAEKCFEVKLRYVDGMPRIHDARRISKLSRRVYRGSKDLRSYKHGFGIQIVSTPKGVMSDKDARKERVGGELLLNMW